MEMQRGDNRREFLSGWLGFVDLVKGTKNTLSGRCGEKSMKRRVLFTTP